ncbi:MAG: Thiamine-phosphate synthase [Legionellaceae bacterium]
MQLHLVIGQNDCKYFSINHIVELAIKGGITHVQLREKEIPYNEFIACAKSLSKQLKPYSIPLIINDSIEVALAINAEGIHLGQKDLSPLKARTLLGTDKIIGLTVETPEQAQEANHLPINYIGVGPIYVTSSKKDAPPILGISVLETICKITSHPVIAIGGINEINASATINAGAQGIAVISAICAAKNPRLITKRLKNNIEINYGI